MSTALATKPTDTDAKLIEAVLVSGDLKALTPSQRVCYYRDVCESLDLNPLTKPFEYITLNGKLTLYARRDCTDQLRNNSSVSVSIIARELVGDCYVVTAKAVMPSGRCDESIGVVFVKGLQGDAMANAMMKSETKAKRRVTLSICGLGMPDESEIEPGGIVVPVDMTVSKTDAMAAKLKEKFKTPDHAETKPPEEHGTVKETGKPGAAPGPETWGTTIPQHIAYSLAKINAATTLERLHEISTAVTRGDRKAQLGEAGLREVMQAITAAEKALAPKEVEVVDDPQYTEDSLNDLKALIDQDGSALRLEELQVKWQQDSADMTNETFSEGIALLQRARNRIQA